MGVFVPKVGPLVECFLHDICGLASCLPFLIRAFRSHLRLRWLGERIRAQSRLGDFLCEIWV